MSIFKENPYTPLPFEMRPNRTYCEIPINATTARFIEIYYVSCNEQEIAKWKQLDILEEAMGTYLQIVEGQPLGDDVYFIYTLQTYIGDISKTDYEEFIEYISDFRLYGLTNFKALIDFCYKQWGVTVNDFIPRSKIHIP